MSTSAPTLALYRALVPAHAAVPSATVTVFLDQAVEAHTSASLGARYDTAMCYYAAHQMQRTPGIVTGGGSAEEIGAIAAQTDSQSNASSGSSTLSRSYAVPSSKDAFDADLRTTRYGQLYLEIRYTRAARAPTFIKVCT